MKQLYPEIVPLHTYQLSAGDNHSIYVEECGNPAGIPVVFLHGGPGAGCNVNHRRYFNPDKYRIVIFDQRGTARSAALDCVEENTTQDLLSDMENIRQLLDIDQWLIFGGSWGATLGLLYAETWPERVLGMILRGTFLARQRDVDWFIHHAGRILPQYWQQFTGFIPRTERDDLIAAYYRRVHGNDIPARNAAVRSWYNWSGRVVTYQLPEIAMLGETEIDKMVREVAIETHYARHNYFIEENQILDNLQRLPQVPIRIVHGRRDITCTLEASWTLSQALPQAELTCVNNGGHLASEPAMIDALITATDAMAEQLMAEFEHD